MGGQAIQPGASSPRTQENPGPTAQQSPAQSLNQSIFGAQGGTMSPQMQQGALQKLGINSPITDQNAGQIQEQLLGKLNDSFKLGAKTLDEARSKMIDALQGQPGMSREELTNASLPDLMARMEGMKQQQSMMERNPGSGPFGQRFGAGAGTPANRMAGLQLPVPGAQMRPA